MRIRNKYKFIRSIAILLFILIGVFNMSIAKTDNKEAEYIDYIISKGETLWSVAGEYKEKNEDVRQYIYDIKKLNNMTDSTVYSGQVIKIKKGQ